MCRQPGHQPHRWGQQQAASGSSVTMSWTVSAAALWAIAAVPINPAPGGPTQVLTMDVSPSGGGTTSPAAGAHTYPEGQVVTITATPSAGYVFDHWTGDVADANSASTTVTMDADKTVTAYFVTKDLTMDVSPSGGGTTSSGGRGPPLRPGQVVAITATPSAGYVFDHWTGDVADANSASTTVTMDADKTVTANFVAEEYSLSVNVVGHGTVSKNPDKATYHYGDQVLLTATPAFGYEFAGWSGDLADGANPQTVTMAGNKAVTATFVQYVPMSLGPDGTPTNGTGAGNASSVTFAHTTGTGTDRLLLVGVSWNCGTTDRSISSVTFTPSGGSAIDLTAVKTQRGGTDTTYRYSAIYRLVDPPRGVTGTVTVTFSGQVSNGSVAGAADFAGVDLSDPLGTAVGAASPDNQATAIGVDLTGLTGNELVFDNVFGGAGSASQKLTAAGGQTQLWNVLNYASSPATNVIAAASTRQATGSSATMSWTAGATGWLAIAAVPINPRFVTVTSPTGILSRNQGEALPVTWTTNHAVATGQFSIWVVSPANGWYGGKIHDAADTVGPASYADSVDLNVPAGAGYRVYVYYRATGNDPWSLHGMSPGTVDVNEVFSAITVSAPTGILSRNQGEALPVTWTTNQAVASGEFSIWVVSPANGWYGGKIHDAADTVGPASYADSVDLNVPAGAGYRVYVYYRATGNDPWSLHGMSPGTVDVNEVFSAITVSAPTGILSRNQGEALPVTWTTNQAVASGEFSIWVVSPANGWYVGKIHDAADTVGPASYADSVDLNVPAGAGYRVYVYYRATGNDPWSLYGMSPGTVDVNEVFSTINVVDPALGTTTKNQGEALPVTWTTNHAVATGQFSIWVVSPANGWYVGKIHDAADTVGPASYADSVDLNVPAGAGYRVYVYYRATGNDPWSLYGMSPGTVDVNEVFSTINVVDPALGTTTKNQGEALPVTWTTNHAVATGQFSIWVVSPANGWYVGKIHAAADTVGPASYADSVDLNVPADTGYRIFVYYRANSGDSWSLYGMSPGTVDVNAP